MSFEIKDLAQFEYLWRNSGQFDPGENRISLKDALSVPNAPLLMPKVITNIVKEAQEPLLIGTSLLQRINYSYGPHISFPAVGALTAGDIGEGMEFPERSLTVGGATVTANIGKSGVAVRITQEMIKYSQFDVIGMHLRAAGKALARWKEQKIFKHIRSQGVPVFDNVTPADALKGVTTGRDLAGVGNGSVTMDDIFDAYGQIITQGFFPNTLLLHPLTWTMFVKDATLRAFVLANGGGSFFASWSGNPAAKAPWDASSQGGLGVSGGQLTTPAGTPSSAAVTPTEGFHPWDINSAPDLPGYLNIPFRVIVSPFVPFDARRMLTDIYMFDSNELGVLVVDEDVQTDEWKDPSTDIQKIKLWERYGIGILNEGKGIAVLKNVHCVPNETVLPAQATVSNVAAISATENVLD